MGQHCGQARLAPAAADPSERRAQRIAELRRAYLAGTLDLRISPDSRGLDQLLIDLFDGGGPPTRP